MPLLAMIVLIVSFSDLFVYHLFDGQQLRYRSKYKRGMKTRGYDIESDETMMNMYSHLIFLYVHHHYLQATTLLLHTLPQLRQSIVNKQL